VIFCPKPKGEQYRGLWNKGNEVWKAKKGKEKSGKIEAKAREIGNLGYVNSWVWGEMQSPLYKKAENRFLNSFSTMADSPQMLRGKRGKRTSEIWDGGHFK